MRRVVLPEKLDSLSEDDPAAAVNRRDLRRINFLMGNFRWLHKMLSKKLGAGDKISEWAAGDGSFGACLTKLRRDVFVTGVDLCRRPSAWPSGWNWLRSDLLALNMSDVSEVVVGNFILHQFEDTQLAQLGKLLDARARLVIFNETKRSEGAVFLARLTGWLFAMHPVTKHDAEVSVRAGFRDEELPELLGFSQKEWQWKITTTVRGSYRMVAERRQS